MALAVSGLRCAAEVPERSGFVTADDGVRLFYRTIGDGPLNVVIPVGFYLEEALRPLAGADRRLVFYDPRARGRSDAGDRSQVTLDRQIADVEALRRGLGIDSMVLIGWSGLGMEMAVYAMRHPGRVIGLVQVAPVAARDEPHNARAYRTRAERTDTAALTALRTRREQGAFADDPAGYCRALGDLTSPANFADSSFMAAVPDPCRFPNEYPDSLGPLFSALLGSFAGYDWRDAIARTPVPRLVIHGAQDAFPLDGSQEWVPPGSNARLLVIERAGHFPFLERPDVFFPAVETFLSSAQSGNVDPGSGPRAAETCPGPEHRQFDFWLGVWDVFNPAGELVGRNTITSELGGCVLHERWGSLRGSHRGNSYNIYDRSAKRWHQTWVDNAGLLLRLDGGPQDGAMVLEGRTVREDGSEQRERISWTPRRDGTVRQLWQQSSDGGRTWTTAFDGRYVRRR